MTDSSTASSLPALVAAGLLALRARALPRPGADPGTGFRRGPLMAWCPAEGRQMPHSVDAGERRCRSCKTTTPTPVSTEDTVEELSGPEYVRPPQKDCPQCGCCTAALCQKGSQSPRRCAGHGPSDLRTLLDACPCSAQTTPYTAAWRVAQVRVTRSARELPLSQEQTMLLRCLAAGEDVPAALEPMLPWLMERGLAQTLLGSPASTFLGGTYLAAVDDVRARTAAEVLAVDEESGTTFLAVPAWRPDEPVTVLTLQITVETGLRADELVGRWLEVEANYETPDADRLVLTLFASNAPAAVAAIAGGGA